MVAQRDEVIGRLRDQAYTQWASRWLAFQKKAANVYQGLDFNFDLPSDEEAEESLSTDYFGEPNTLLRPTPLLYLLPLLLMYNLLRIDMCSLFLTNIHFFI